MRNNQFVPKWKTSKLSDRSVTTKIKAGGTPSRKNPAYWNNGTIPFVKINDITNSNKYLYETKEKITEKGLKNSSAWIVEPDSLLYSMYASYGEPIITKIPVATNQAIIALKPSNVNLDFLYYSLMKLKHSLTKFIRESTQKNLNAGIVKNLEISVPPLVEQHGIAEILTTVDECIRYTDLIIEKTEELKRGLMQQLFTKGIGHTNFKETSLGKMPDTWKINSIRDIGEVITGNTPSTKNDEYYGNDYQFVSPFDITDNNYIYSTKKKLSKSGFNITRKIPPYSILVICISSFDGIGRLTINWEECATNQQINAIIVKNAITDYVYYAIQFYRPYLKLLATRSGGLFAIVNKSNFEQFKIPTPPIKEQTKIAKILSSLDKKKELHRMYGKRLGKLKSGLMQILLSGKVRVELGENGLHRIRNS